MEPRAVVFAYSKRNRSRLTDDASASYVNFINYLI